VLCLKKKKEKKEDVSKYEIVDIGLSCLIQSPQIKKKELKFQWKDDEWVFETKTEEECNSWMDNLEQFTKTDSI